LELKDPSKVKKILPFTGSLKLGDARVQLDDPLQQLNLIMEGACARGSDCGVPRRLAPNPLL
jgi:hypothetical protein